MASLNCSEGTGTARLRDAQGAWPVRLRNALRGAAAGASLCALVGALALVSNSAGKGAAEGERGVAPSFSLELLQSQTPGFRVAGAGDARAYPPPGKVFAHDYVETMLRIQQLPHNCTGQSCCACGCCLHTTCARLLPPCAACLRALHRTWWRPLSFFYPPLPRPPPAAETGGHCCREDAPFTCCCTQFKDEHEPRKNITLAIPLVPHHCEDVGPHCCDAGAPFECCCGLMGAVVKNKTLVKIHDESSATISQVSHQCNETGPQCCAEDAPFTCCCVLSKESKQQQLAAVVAARKSPPEALLENGESHSKHEKARAKVAHHVEHDNQAAAGQSASRVTVKNTAVKETTARLEKEAAGMRPVTAEDKARAEAAKRRAEELKEIKDAILRIDLQSAKKMLVPMPAQARAVQKFAKSYFGHDQRHAELRKDLAKDASAHLESRNDIDAKEHVSLGMDGRVLMSRKDASMTELTMKALNELGMDEKELARVSASSQTMRRASRKGSDEESAKATLSDMFGAPSDASARAWQPPAVDFSNLVRGR
jgi:hypothetical protein